MDYAVHVPLFGDGLYSFSDICENIHSSDDAELLKKHILETNYSPGDVDFLATALLHAGYPDCFASVISTKYYEAKNRTKSVTIKHYAQLCAHLSLYYLQKFTNGEDIDTSKEKSQELYAEASSIDPKLNLSLLTHYYWNLLNGNSIQDQFEIVKKQLKNQLSFIDLSALTYLGAGFTAFQHGQYDEALREFREVLLHHANSVPLVRLAIGQTLMAQRKFKEAELAFQCCVSICEQKGIKSPVAETALGVINFNYHTEEGINKSLDHLLKVIKIDPNYPPALLLRAQIFFNSDANRKKASKDIKKAINCPINAIRAEAYFQAGRYAHWAKLDQNCEKYYETALQINPNHARAKYAIGLFQANKGKFDKAVESLEFAIKELHETFDCNACLGLSYAAIYQENKYQAEQARENAIRALEKANQIAQKQEENEQEPPAEYGKVLLTLGWLYIKSLNFVAAEKILRQAKKLQKKQQGHANEDTLTFLAIAMFQCTKYQKALNLFKKIDEVKPDDAIIQYNIARCYEELGRISEAKQMYKDLHATYRQFPEPLLRIAAIASRESESRQINAEAKDALSTILQEIDSKNVRAWIELGRINAVIRQYGEASKNMENAQRNAIDDGYLYATVSLGNYFLQSAQQKDDKAKRDERISHALKMFKLALKANHKCVAAANGIAICWLLTGHVSDAKDALLLAKEYRPEQPRSWENLGFAYMREESYASAMSLFEECNKKFYDKTNPYLLQQYFYASKYEKKFDNCLAVAEQLCALRPDYILNWYYLASSLHKVVLREWYNATSSDKVCKPAQVQCWINQVKRCIFLFNYFAESSQIASDQKTSVLNKVEDIQTHLLEKLNKLLVTAKEAENRKNEQYRRAIERASVNADQFSTDIPGPEDENEIRRLEENE